MNADVFKFVDLTDEEVDELESRYGPLAAAVRELNDAIIRTQADEVEVAEALAAVEAATAILEPSMIEGPAGVSYNENGRSWSWGNAAIGLRNAVAPPMEVQFQPGGESYAEVFLGAAYEGPPGMAHGGVSALLLDHIMGVTASQLTQVTFTGTLTLKYRNPLPLGRVQLFSRVSGTEGRKVFVEARIEGDAGVAVEADGIFIVPNWSV